MSNIPETFHCPISLEIMYDPVCDKEGNTFEKSAITDWINRHGCSPITRTPMSLSDLVPNRALKDLILQHFKKPVQPKLVTPDEIQQFEEDKIEIKTFVDDSKMLISIDPGDSEVRTFLNVSCVIDVSGSMGSEATLPGENNKRESFGLSILDIVKHAVITVVKSLNANDRLAIVTFSNTADLVLPLTSMDENGQAIAITAVKALCPMSNTNLWSGLETGLDVLNSVDDDEAHNRLSTLLLLTDGVPNVIPPRGHLPMLQMYKDRHGGLPGSINTFGFGYDLDSELLNSLAMEGKGGYSFIPDSGFVGTTFINALANLKVTIAKSCRLTIELLNGAEFVNPSNDLGEYLTAQEGWGITVDIGSIQTGQTKDISLQMNNLPPEGTPFASIVLNAKTRTNNAFKFSLECDAYRSSDRILPTHFRFKFIKTVKDAMKLMSLQSHLVQDLSVKSKETESTKEEPHTLIKNLVAEMQSSCSDSKSMALLQDIEGQVVEAFQADYYRKWGRHYLPSLLYAHLYQVCTNFKDIGLQVYGGKLFQQLRDEADTLFCSLPPPQPSRPIQPHTITLWNMGQFQNSRAVCFHGKGVVRLYGGIEKNVESIRKGDQIETSNGTTATVICVVETKIHDQTVELVKCPSGLLITPWHPIRLDESSDWIFPISLSQPEPVKCESVYNFVLNAHHVIKIDDIDCVTLGHSFTDSVCAHDYFGTTRVIRDLQNMSGFDSGMVKVIGVRRDPKTSVVDGLVGE